MGFRACYKRQVMINGYTNRGKILQKIELVGSKFDDIII